MAFIKANNQFNIGTKVRLFRNIESMSGTLLEGTIVKKDTALHLLTCYWIANMMQSVKKTDI